MILSDDRIGKLVYNGHTFCVKSRNGEEKWRLKGCVVYRYLPGQQKGTEIEYGNDTEIFSAGGYDGRFSLAENCLFYGTHAGGKYCTAAL